MASLFWSWIFIFSLVRPGLALVTEVLAQRAAAAATTHGLTKAEKSRNTFIALAVAFTVVIIAIIAGVVALLLRKKDAADAEVAGVAPEKVEKPHWFMVDSKKDWWPINMNLRPATPKEQEEHPDGSRTARLREALNKMAVKTGKPLLPMHNDKATKSETSKYPDVLERGYRAPIYPAQPQIPALTRTMYEGDKPQPRSPPKAVVTQGLARTFARHDRRGMPRSPAGRRKSWLTRGHPFIPLKDDAQVLPAPKTAAFEAPRRAPRVPTTTPLLAPPSPPRQKRVPPPLQLVEQLERRVRFGLTSSPRGGLPTSPRPQRIQSPAF